MSKESINSNEYWAKQLQDAPSLNLPIINSHIYKTIKQDSFYLSEQATKQLNNICRNKKQSVMVFCLAVYYVLIHKFFELKDIVIWIPGIKSDGTVAGQDILFFIRNSIEEGMTFKDILIMVNRSMSDAIYHYDENIPNIYKKNSIETDKFDCGIFFEKDFVIESLVNAGSNHQALFVLGIDWAENVLGCNVYYSDNISSLIAKSIKTYCLELFEKACQDPAFVIDQFNVHVKRQRKQLNTVILDDNTTINEFLNRSIKKYANKAAIVFHDEIITYQQLGVMVNRIANHLKQIINADGSSLANTLIPVLVDRSMDSVLSVLGILMSGCAYVPIDASYPISRIEYILNDCNADVLLYSNNLPDISFNGEKVNIQNVINDNSIPTNFIKDVELSSSSLAYVIYTSGSTGNPKGTLIQHRNVIELLIQDSGFSFGESDTWTLYHSLCFDFSVWELFGCLFFGGTLLVLAKDDIMDIQRLNHLMKQYHVSVLNQTPNAFFNLMSVMLDEDDPSVYSIRYIIFGGDKLHPKMLEAFSRKYSNIQLINMYGITETTVQIGRAHV